MADFSAPLRVSWELPSSAERVTSYWQKLREARVLFVEAFAKPNNSKSIASLCALAQEVEAKPGPILTVVAQVDQLEALVECAPNGVLEKVEAVVVPPYPANAEIEKLAVYFKVFTIGLWSTAEGLGSLAQALELVEGSPNLGISVMNPAVTDKSAPPALSEDDRQRALKAWSAAASKPERVHIHDLFLSEALGLEPFKSYGGCAAAGGLAHLGEDGVLVACRTLPLYLGDLNTSTLTELWSGEERSAARRAIEAIPHGCGGCEKVEVCRGGCPGLAQSVDKADLSCLIAKH